MGAQVSVLTWVSQYPSVLYPGSVQKGSLRFDPEVEPVLHWAKPSTWTAVGERARGADLLVIPWVTPFQAMSVRRMVDVAHPTPVVLMVHNVRPHETRLFDSPITRWGLEGVNAAVVHSRAVATDLSEMMPGIRIRIVGHPPNISHSRTPLPGYPPIRALFIGNVRHYKGLDIGIRAMAHARNEGFDIRLTVAGSFWEPIAKYQRLVRALGLVGVVDLRPGYVTDEELSRLIAEHHFIMAPYRTATQSGIVPLALTAGRPVIATRVGGLEEVVRDRVDGVLADATANDIAHAMVEMCNRLPELASAAGHWHAPRWIDVADAILTLGTRSQD